MGKRLSGLLRLLATELSRSDVIPILDVSEPKTKGVTAGDLMALNYPVGSIYQNASVATNPATLLGFGTWTAIPHTYDRQFLSAKLLQWSTGDVTGTTTKQRILGTYDYNMLTTMLFTKSGTLTIPTGYHIEYRLQTELSTSGDTMVKVFLNNIETNLVQTWSGPSFRSTASTDYFKSTDVVLETTVGYSNPGINFGWVATSANAAVRVYEPIISAFLVRDTPIYKWIRTA